MGKLNVQFWVGEIRREYIPSITWQSEFVSRIIGTSRMDREMHAFSVPKKHSAKAIAHIEKYLQSLD